MGYTTQFKGVLKFKAEPTREQLAELKQYLGGDLRGLDPSCNAVREDFAVYIQFELASDFSGIQWDGSEKFSGPVAVVNWLTVKMREVWPEFAFTGQLAAQGEDVDDRWILKMVNGVATKVETPPTGRRVECPHCEQHFYID